MGAYMEHALPGSWSSYLMLLLTQHEKRERYDEPEGDSHERILRRLRFQRRSVRQSATALPFAFRDVRHAHGERRAVKLLVGVSTLADG